MSFPVASNSIICIMFTLYASCSPYMHHVHLICIMFTLYASCSPYMHHVHLICIMFTLYASCSPYMHHVHHYISSVPSLHISFHLWSMTEIYNSIHACVYRILSSTIYWIKVHHKIVILSTAALFSCYIKHRCIVQLLY